MSRAATMAEADAFCSHMASKFGAIIVPADIISDAFRSTIGIDPTQFLTAIGITLGPLIWMKPGLSPDERIEVMCHETQHVVQQRREGWTTQWWHYLASNEERVRYESESYRAGSLELYHARYGQIPALDDLVSPMGNGYLLGASDLSLARDLLEAAATSVAASPPVYCTESAIEAIAWLKVNAAELLAG